MGEYAVTGQDNQPYQPELAPSRDGKQHIGDINHVRHVECVAIIICQHNALANVLVLPRSLAKPLSCIYPKSSRSECRDDHASRKKHIGR
jgi:hypothetical protein